MMENKLSWAGGGGWVVGLTENKTKPASWGLGSAWQKITKTCVKSQSNTSSSKTPVLFKKKMKYSVFVGDIFNFEQFRALV